MRSILDLFHQQEEVWFWIEEKYQDRFFDELMNMNAIFLNGDPVTRETIRHCMGVHNDKTVGYVSNLVWYKTFSSPTAPVKVDYGKYIEAKDDYVFSKSNIQPLDVTKLLGGKTDE